MTSAEISALLGEAARSGGVILSRHGLRRFGEVSVSQLKDDLRQISRQDTRQWGGDSRTILGEKSAEPLGDAPAWIDAGGIYEELASVVSAEGSPGFVFCLDPWVGQLRSRSSDLTPGSKWILVSDFYEWRREGPKDYWDQLEQWLGSLSFSAIISGESWDQVLGETPATPTQQSDRGIHRSRPGAWQWRKLSRGSKNSSASPIFLIRYSGSSAHLRVCLESISRQRSGQESLWCFVLMDGPQREAEDYLRWAGLSLPHLKLRALDIRRDKGDAWRAELNRDLLKVPDAALVMIGDHTLLPSHFARFVQAEDRVALQGVAVNVETTAHLLTGNLDLQPNYQNLLAAFSSGPAGSVDCGRILPPQLWRKDGLDPVSRILSLSLQPTPGEGASTIPLLNLADLP